MDDPLGAFCRHVDVALPGAAAGPLAGLSFAAKDIYDVAGHSCCCGNPDWLASHAPAEHTAPAVTALLDAGASLAGKTLTDELAFSLNGENHHYGTPVNSAAPRRVPGGSSNGSAAAVAGGLVDFALGSDTGGSVRAPASYCGIFGIRPSHGAIALAGIMPLAPSFDTVGWFTRDAALLERVGDVLLPPGGKAAAGRVLVAEDAFARMIPAARPELEARIAPVAAALGHGPETVTIAGEGLDKWLAHFQALQWREIWESHGDWITRTRPAFGPGIDERFRLASQVPDAVVAAARAFRAQVAGRMRALLADGAVLVLPSAPGPAPLKALAQAAITDYRNRALGILCVAGLAGLPQVSVPATTVEGAPVGLSLVGGPGSDRALLAMARKAAAALA
ncbi:MAG: amidase [Inquilinus sp.]|nr:amidase [Inquilinus sp.]